MRKRRILRYVIITILAVSLTLTPAIGVTEVHAGDNGEYLNSPADTNLEGKNALGIMIDKNKKDVLQDPMFYRYYDIGMFGKIKKKTQSDEMDSYNKPSSDSANAQAGVGSEFNSMGCGVSGLGKAEVPKKYRTYKKYNCLDISEWQGRITDANWRTVKKTGVTHVIIRVGGSRLKSGTSFSDTYYARNINGAYKAGLKIGVYYFSQALTTSEAKREAEYTIKLIKSYKDQITLPVVFDYESNESGRLTGKKLKSLGKSGTATKICEAFCDKVKYAGYEPMVYANYSTLTNHLNYKALEKKYKIWLANYTTKGAATTYPGEYYAWQYSSSGKVSGLNGYIDMNYIFVREGNKPAESNKSEEGSSSKPTETTAPTEATASTGTKPTSKNFKVSNVTPYKIKTTSAVNYRIGPGTNYKKKGTYKKGKVLTVKGKCKMGSATWAKLSNGYFINLKYAKKYGYNVKTTTELNYRTGPGADYKKKGTYKKGKVLTIVSEKKGWGKTSGGYYILLKYTKKQ